MPRPPWLLRSALSDSPPRRSVRTSARPQQHGRDSRCVSCGICSDSSQLTDDSKIGRNFRSQSDVNNDLQGDLDWLDEWVVRWQMECNIDKCRVMNVGNLEGEILTTGTT